MSIEMKQIVSSNIDAIGHEGTTLYVRFKTGPTWKYSDVNEATYREMAAAESVGSYFSKHVKPNHKAERVSDSAAP